MVQFPAEERAKLVAASGDIWEDWVKEQEAAGRPGREILNFVKAEVAKYKQLSRRGEPCTSWRSWRLSSSP